MIIWIKRLFCDHWWKCITHARSPYFVYAVGRAYLEYELDECKQCGKTRVRKLTEDII